MTAHRTAVDIAQRVSSGTESAEAVVRAHLAAIAARDRLVGAFQQVRHERAIAEAATIDKLAGQWGPLPLAGVPVAIKDNIPVAGEPMRVGSAATSERPSPSDHEVVRRLRDAGAVIVGTTRVPELALWGTCDGAFGTSRSPWDMTRTAGGSSGGSAAAVAAALVPVAHGNDGLGSIRIPAACCGLVGIKPGAGVVPSALGSTSWFGIAENGALATTAADAALLLSVLASQPSLARVREPGPLRIALATQPPAVGVGVDRERAERTRAIAALLAADGHIVTEVRPPMPSPLQLLGIVGTWGVGARDEVDAILAGDPSAIARFERRTLRHARMGSVARMLRLDAERHRSGWRATMDRFLERVDILMTPTLARAPLKADAWRERGWLANVVANMLYAPFCGPVNFSRLPAIAVPAGVHDDATPASVHFVGRDGSEPILLGLAAQVERLQPWQRHAPDFRAPVAPAS